MNDKEPKLIVRIGLVALAVAVFGIWLFFFILRPVFGI